MPQIWDLPVRGPYVVALLPGSRRSEIASLLPVQLAAAERLAERIPIELRLIQAPDLPDSVIAGHVEKCSLNVRIIKKHRMREIAGSHIALCASGTATLEVGLTRTPMVVVYRVKRWSYWLGRLVVRVPHISLVNLVLGEAVVPELIQNEASAENIARMAAGLIEDRALRDRTRSRLAQLRTALGEPGASRRAARQTLEVMRGARS
jgi:lipid-A-disaccharide synthase